MASRLPIVATKVAGIPEIVQHNGNGILVPEKDPVQLAAAIQVMAADRALLERFGECFPPDRRGKVCPLRIPLAN